MAKVTALNYFSPNPGRANRDKRLTGLHFRVLGVIAGHDRMGRNGQCCWAGAAKLATLVDCNPKSLSSALSDLLAWGYLEAERHQEDARRKGYRVVYDPARDAEGIGIAPADRSPVANLSARGNRSPVDDLSAGPDRSSVANLSTPRNRSPIDYLSAEIGSQNDTQFSAQNTERDNDNSLLDQAQQTLIYSVETEDITRSRAGDGKFAAEMRRKIAAKLGSDGWAILTALSEDELRWLERREADGTLTEIELGEARMAFNRSQEAAR